MVIPCEGPVRHFHLVSPGLKGNLSLLGIGFLCSVSWG